MARLTDEDKRLIAVRYQELGSYAAVARETGFSSSTVKKYADAAVQDTKMQNTITTYEVSPLSIEEVTATLKIPDFAFVTEAEKKDIQNFLKLFNVEVKTND